MTVENQGYLRQAAEYLGWPRVRQALFGIPQTQQ